VDVRNWGLKGGNSWGHLGRIRRGGKTGGPRKGREALVKVIRRVAMGTVTEWKYPLWKEVYERYQVFMKMTGRSVKKVKEGG